MPTLIPLANNLIRNGNFAAREEQWTAVDIPPGRVDFSAQSCIIRTSGRAEQVVPMFGATFYTFSVYTLITYNGAGSATLLFQPSGTTESIALSGNHGWVRQSLNFSTPTDTTDVIVQLLGNSGDVWFDNVRLVEEEGTVIPIELIRNGDFSSLSSEWTSSESPNPTFHDERCQLNLGAFIEQNISVTPGQTYTFSIDAQTPTGGHGFVRFHLTPDNVQEIELRGDGGWDTYPYSLTIPAGTPDFTLQIEGVTFLIIDNVSLKLAT